MPGQPLVMGPFPGGINNRTDVASIDDTELVSCVNFIYGIDGTLVSRYPIVEGPETGLSGLASSLNLLGYTVMYSSVSPFDVSVNSVCFGSNAQDGTWVLGNSIWSRISINEYLAFAAYGNTINRVFFPSNPYNSTEYGGWWKYGDSGITQVNNTPAGTTMALHKERLWIAGDTAFPSRLYYSGVTPDGSNKDWDQTEGAGFIDVDPGNGQSIVNIKAFSDQIVIFKDDSTYVLSYDGTISRGQLVQVNNDIGTENNQTVVEYKNVLSVYHEGKVYAYANGSYTELNEKYRFISDSGYVATYTKPISLSTIGDALILRHYNKLFYYSFLTGGWCDWSTIYPVGNFVQQPVFVGDEVKTFLVSSILSTDKKVYQMKQTWGADTEDFVCSMTTKTYNFQTPYAYKRLFWWGIEAVSNLLVTAAASPISVTYSPTWGDVKGPVGNRHKWGSYLNNTWGNLLSSIPDVVTTVDSPTGTTNRRMYKFLKSLRFRQISFKISMVSDGTSSNGPQRLISVIPFIAAKETVVKQVS